MSVKRTAMAMAGAAAMTAAMWPVARASDAGLDLSLPEVPAVSLVLDPPRDADARPALPGAAARKPDAVDLPPPGGPEAVVTVAPDPAVGSPPASVVTPRPDPLGAAVAARLTEPLLAPLRLARPEREALHAFYAVGDFQPVWLKGGAWTAAARLVIARLAAAAEDGLEPTAYPVPPLPTAGREASLAEVAEADVKLSALAVLYARDARGARIEPARLSQLITPKLELPAADQVLTSLAAAPDAGEALAAYNPPHEGYRALKRKLAETRTGEAARSRLEGDILANMERWRWLPAEMGRRHVWVNIPEYKLRLVKDGRSTYEARVIVGKPDTQTPVFSDEMDHAVVNPSWYVPPSIFKNEFHSDPAYAAARGYDVVRGKNGALSIRQPPGERNALGFIKFMFPNQHAVYLHDTPNRKLFGAEKRAFSHGCVRLDQPFRFGEFVLGAEWTEPRLKSLIGRGERSIRLPEKVQVHLTYFTTFVDELGELRQAADLYAVNNKVRVALGLPSDGTMVADAKRVRPAPAVVERPQRVRTAAAAVERQQRLQPTPRLQAGRPVPLVRTRVSASQGVQPRRRPAQFAPAQAVVQAPSPAVEPVFYWWMLR